MTGNPSGRAGHPVNNLATNAPSYNQFTNLGGANVNFSQGTKSGGGLPFPPRQPPIPGALDFLDQNFINLMNYQGNILQKSKNLREGPWLNKNYLSDGNSAKKTKKQ
jgi:hypothetical protein